MCGLLGYFLWGTGHYPIQLVAYEVSQALVFGKDEIAGALYYGEDLSTITSFRQDLHVRSCSSCFFIPWITFSLTRVRLQLDEQSGRAVKRLTPVFECLALQKACAVASCQPR